MKSTLTALAMILSTSVYTTSVSAAVTTEGYYYTTVQYFSGQAHFNQVGAFSNIDDCNVARQNDYGDGGAIPWDGGPGCFYLSANNIPGYNELLEHWSGQVGNGGIPVVNGEFQELLQNVTILVESHQIVRYRQSMNKLSVSQPR